jgi:hypothetical protein
MRVFLIVKGALLLLGDEEAALLGGMAATLLLGDEARWRSELLRLLGGVDAMEVYPPPRPAGTTPPRRTHAWPRASCRTSRG